MKKVICKFSSSALIMMLLLSFCVSLAGCGSSSKVAGTWYNYNPDHDYANPERILKIKDDGTYTYTNNDGTFSGSWKLSDSVITFTADSSKYTSSGVFSDTHDNKKGNFITVSIDPGKKDTVGEFVFERQ
ncbi:lipocalin-like domain-containing protein [Gardnerella vaginalis]|uniref:Uncharacterized protein n=1 Tax=Gardnerella vaginalis TaxID=2702 RepID=A0A2K1SWC3_GARVA|nr:glycoside hydrolase family 43 C-terminal domain-containing protein [Gardnerella vaginalis]PNS43847.1 hypothetical protein BFS05_01110 [Gardnerella vaginalis]